MSFDGDFLIDSAGDLKDTSEDLLLSIKNEILSYIKSDIGEWREHPNIGADLSDFVGESNTQRTAEAIQTRIKNTLSLLVSASDLTVRVVPIGLHKVLVSLQLKVTATTGNRRRPGDTIVVSFLYDYFERGIFVPIEQMNQIAERKI